METSVVRLSYNEIGEYFTFSCCNNGNEDEHTVIHPKLKTDTAVKFVDFIREKYGTTSNIEQIREEFIPFLSTYDFSALILLKTYGEESK